MIELFSRAVLKLKVVLHHLLNYRIYKRDVILFGVPVLINRQNLVINKGTRINSGVLLQADGGIELGEGVTLSRNVSIITTGYDTSEWKQNKKKKIHAAQPVKIGNYTWIGANVLILKGVTIGNGCIIGAGSVVTKDLLHDNALYAGNPAKFIKYLA